MKLHQTLIVLLSLSAAGASIAQTSGGTIEGSSSTVNLDNTSLTTVSGSVGASLLLRGLSAEAGGGGVVIGGFSACDGGVIRGVVTDVKMRNAHITASGPVHIGHVSAGCK